MDAAHDCPPTAVATSLCVYLDTEEVVRAMGARGTTPNAVATESSWRVLSS